MIIDEFFKTSKFMNVESKQNKKFRREEKDIQK